MFLKCIIAILFGRQHPYMNDMLHTNFGGHTDYYLRNPRFCDF
jgi:hypothetical protein